MFYIVLSGQCHVWVPVSIQQMKLTFKKLSESVMRTQSLLENGHLSESLPFELAFIDDGQNEKNSKFHRRTKLRRKETAIQVQVCSE